MKATINYFRLCVATAAVLTASALQAGPLDLARQGLLVMAVSAPPTAEAARQSEELLRQARAAMQEGKLELADSLIGRAEQLGAPSEGLFSRPGDSAKKAREDWNRLRGAAGVAGGKVDPFAAQHTETAAAPNSGYPDTGFKMPTGGGESDAASNADLLQARRALAAGDERGASEILARAKAAGAGATAGGDSPARVEALLARYQDFKAGPPRTGDPGQFMGKYVQFLLDESEELARYRDIDGARRVAEQAKAFQVNYGPNDRTPERVLAALNGGRAARAEVGDLPAEQPARLPELPRGASPNSTVNAASAGKVEAGRLLAIARSTLDRGDLDQAERLVHQAESLNVPDAAYGQGETRPWELLLEIGKQRNRRGPSAVGAVAAIPTEAPGGVSRGVYHPNNDPSRVVRAGAEEAVPGEAGSPGNPPVPTPEAGGPPAAGQSAPQPPAKGEGERLYQDGLKALQAKDRNAAAQLFRQAWKYQAEMDPRVRTQLQEQLSRISVGTPGRLPAAGEAAKLEGGKGEVSVAARQFMTEIAAERERAEKTRGTDPKGALERLKALRERVAKAEIDPPTRQRLLVAVDRHIDETDKFIEQNRGQLELDDANRKAQAAVDQDRRVRVEVQGKLGELVVQYNKLIDQERFAEAEKVARQAREFDPENPVTQLMIAKVGLAKGLTSSKRIQEDKERGFLDNMLDGQKAMIAMDPANPLQYPKKGWDTLTTRRGRETRDRSTRYSPAEREIEKALLKNVDVKFQDRPLGEVLETLGKMAGVNVYLDPQGLAAEGVTIDSPVRLNLGSPVTFKSALHLILEPLKLSYVIQDEVLRISSEQARNSDVYTKVYYVADLVIPIPNFVPSYYTGLPSALRESMAMAGAGGNLNGFGGAGSQPLTMLAQDDRPGSASALAQVMGAGARPGTLAPGALRRGAPGTGQQLGAGPGGAGGGVQPEFDTLIDLIQATVAPESWQTGKGAIQGFDATLSLVVSNTQEVHDQLTDLLEQLRRLQDIQVTLEVRFINLSDQFFERLGVSFDFNIATNLPTGITAAQAANPPHNPSLTVGLNQAKAITNNFAIPYVGPNFAQTAPSLPGLNFTAGNAASFGFAILSDIEVFFLIQAMQSDSRTNIMQSPKVTLFNGQSATVSDNTQRPFVTSVVPVVGDFAAAQQPVVVVLNEGTSLGVQATVSNDRRFVRLTLLPFFSSIGDVSTFNFNGSTTTTGGTTKVDPTDPTKTVVDGGTTTTSGTTVQLPTFQFTTVSTTVSVPDGGTVLLGGVKRMSEARKEIGVPMLSKIPYINRLFRNTGIERTGSSLMLMVTPRIIIQEEEEEKLGINQGG